MFPVFALIFLIVPLVEIYILIQVGQVIGALWTVFFVVLTAVIGVHLLKSQGLSTLSRAQQKMHQGELPAEELLEGMALLLAGAFLLTPGFVTDSFGFLLLFPPGRAIIIASLVKRMLASGHYVVQGEFHSRTHSRSADVIEDVKYHKHDDESADR